MAFVKFLKSAFLTSAFVTAAVPAWAGCNCNVPPAPATYPVNTAAWNTGLGQPGMGYGGPQVGMGAGYGGFGAYGPSAAYGGYPAGGGYTGGIGYGSYGYGAGGYGASGYGAGAYPATYGGYGAYSGIPASAPGGYPSAGFPSTGYPPVGYPAQAAGAIPSGTIPPGTMPTGAMAVPPAPGMYPGTAQGTGYGPPSLPYGGMVATIGPHWAPGGYEPRIGSPAYYYDPAGGQYVVTGNPYYDHFGPGFHRDSIHGHYRFPYYSYRTPWYYPGRAVYNRNTNFAW